MNQKTDVSDSNPNRDRYTVIFAVARTVGWVSQWKESMLESALKITRPRQVGCFSVSFQTTVYGARVQSADRRGALFRSLVSAPLRC